MAEQIPIAARTDHRREILLLVVLGFGALVFSFGTMTMYIEPEEKPLEITLQSRPRTEPRRLESGGDAGGGESARTETAAITPAAPTESPVATAAPAPTAAPSPAPTTAPPLTPPAGPGTAAPAQAPPATTVAPVPIVQAATRTPEPALVPAIRERVRIIRRQVGRSMIEIHDFTNGVEYRGEIHDFRSGQPSRWIQDREKGAGQ